MSKEPTGAGATLQPTVLAHKFRSLSCSDFPGADRGEPLPWYILDMEPCLNVIGQGPLPKRRGRVVSRATNVTYQDSHVSREQRGEILGAYKGHRGATLWFTGLSGAGKTTIAFAIEATLVSLGVPAYGLDGDNMRCGVCSDLAFKPEDRKENIRRVAEVAKLMADTGLITLASFISPFAEDRQTAKEIHEKAGLPFIEIFVDTPLEICEERDAKGLYAKARAGKIKGFTGIDSRYESPSNPDLRLEAGEESVTSCVHRVLEELHQKKILPDMAYQQLFGPKELFVDAAELPAEAQAAKQLPELAINKIDLQWLQVLAEGWASPLGGFMRERQYLQWRENGLLFDLHKDASIPNSINSPPTSPLMTPGGSAPTEHSSDLHSLLNQSVPILLPLSTADKERLMEGGKAPSEISLSYEGRIVAVMTEPEFYRHRKEDRAARTYGTTDASHPGVALIMDSGDWLVGGELRVLDRIRWGDGLDAFRLTPTELRMRFRELKADAVFVFQLRNPIHNGHGLLMADTRAKLKERGYQNPVLLLHPLGGWTKDDDVPLDVRIRQHEAVLADEGGPLGGGSTVLSIFPSPMLYAGPTEVQWHARARLAAGVHFYIVGRDPAGIKDGRTGEDLYDGTHGARVLGMAPGLGGLEILPFRPAAFDTVQGRMDFFDEDRKADFLNISGTKMRAMAAAGEEPPAGFMVSSAWDILAEFYRAKKAKTN